MTQVIYKRFDGTWCMTDEKNYYAYVQNARAVHVLQSVETLSDVYELIERLCQLYGCEETDFIIIQ